MNGAGEQRLNHYATLGIRPDASAAEIERAFRAELNPFVPHMIGGVAAASVAYATLSNPAKRRAYDQAHGLNRPDERPAAPMLASADWVMGSAHVIRASPRIARSTATISESLPCERSSQPLHPTDHDREQDVDAPAAIPTGPASPVAPTRTLAADPPRPAQIILSMDEIEERPIDARKGLIILGAIGAVALSGGALGWFAGSEAGDVQAGQIATPLPRARPEQLSIISPSDDVVAAQEAPLAASPPPRRARPAPGIVAATPASSAPSSEVRSETPPQPDASDPSANIGGSEADALAPVPSEASMPLSNATVARTIDRIGYRCGSVTNTQSSGGGVFEISCSSGQRFRASPRNGRYRFKRV